MQWRTQDFFLLKGGVLQVFYNWMQAVRSRQPCKRSRGGGGGIVGGGLQHFFFLPQKMKKK